MTEKMRIELTLLMPAVPDARDTCVTRLSDLLRAKEGIADAHWVDSDANVHPGGVNVVFADGSTRFVAQEIDWKVWRAVGSMGGGEVVHDF